LRKEFTESRNLKPLKVIITGPPASGKTYLSKKLAVLFNLPHYTILDIVSYGLNLTDELGEEVKAKIDELKEKIKEELEAEIEAKKKKSEVDTTPRLPDELLYKILKRMLKENICRNRGYILDGYPRSHQDCDGVFMDIDDTKEENDPERLKLSTEIVPNRIIKLDNYTDEFLFSLAKEIVGPNSHYNEEGMIRRIKKYKLLNESPTGDLNICDFFNRKDIQVLNLDCKLNEEKLIQQSKIYFEKVFLNNFRMVL
jgi:adenylate kinase